MIGAGFNMMGHDSCENNDSDICMNENALLGSMVALWGLLPLSVGGVSFVWGYSTWEESVLKTGDWQAHGAQGPQAWAGNIGFAFSF